MFFDDKKGSGGIAKAILGGAKTEIAEPAPHPQDHELLTHDLLDAVHKRDMQRTHDTLHALFTHFQARQESEPTE